MRYFVGIFFIVIGMFLRFWSVKVLGKDFKEIIQMPSRIVLKGPYKYIKHPAYWGSILVILGVSLIKDILGILLLAYYFYRSRMVVEDEIIRRMKKWA